MTDATAPTQELAKNSPRLADLTNLSEVAEYYGGIENIQSAEILGDGFTILDNLDKLVDVPILIVEWSKNKTPSNFGDFCIARILTFDPDSMNVRGRFVVTNGSIKSGLAHDLLSLSEDSAADGIKPVFAKRGLRVSRYTVDLPDAKTGELKPTPAATYYVNTDNS